METNEKLEMIKTLTKVSGLIIINKIEGKDNTELLSKAKKIAECLSKEGIGEFDFASDEKFEKSLNDFLEVK